MRYEYVAIPDEDVPVAADPLFQHVVMTYASETNKTVSLWRAIPDDLLDYKPHEKTNTIRAILAHQILSEWRFFSPVVGTPEPPAPGLLPPRGAPPPGGHNKRQFCPAQAPPLGVGCGGGSHPP